jgi:hypothetical protein
MAGQFPVEFRAGGNGVSFGSASNGDYHNVSMPQKSYEQPDLPVMTFTSKAVAQATLGSSVVISAAIVLCLDDKSLWLYTAD